MSHSHLNNLFSDCFSSMELKIGATDTNQTLDPWFQSDTSSGYLQDAIAGKGIWCKEQNLPSCCQKEDKFPIFSTTVPPLHDCGFTHKKRSISTSLSSTTQGDTHEAAIKHDPAQNSYASGERKKIAYPFKLVKSGGVGGETTLKDINYQILTTPSASKPIPHPVKDSVSLPCKLVKGSFGLSGKTVTSLTRIHTRGRGSITIIRTKD
ncbi:hypothetical protein PHAVU_008G239400 [Phaseolus vulgaris]|uniref:Protein XRI1 n=1 Tax=Phaseolus vulgaris TaxID=3885 RepID=V7B8M5_PHAVU|nr:hypothetical protein PHAVU_008G239400g [Phaseolus vulgaris]ESW13940.1 hypothetical protein PHAVU_008G239400g [Phaseolus vulgaris]